jgi:hypothetical protein
VTFRSLASDIFGVVLIALGFAWSGFDAYSHAGRVSTITLVGALVLAATGGWLVSKTKTLELIAFLVEQAKQLAGIKISLPTSDRSGAGE